MVEDCVLGHSSDMIQSHNLTHVQSPDSLGYTLQIWGGEVTLSPYTHFDPRGQDLCMLSLNVLHVSFGFSQVSLGSPYGTKI